MALEAKGSLGHSRIRRVHLWGTDTRFGSCCSLNAVRCGYKMASVSPGLSMPGKMQLSVGFFFFFFWCIHTAEECCDCGEEGMK